MIQFTDARLAELRKDFAHRFDGGEIVDLIDVLIANKARLKNGQAIPLFMYIRCGHCGEHLTPRKDSLGRKGIVNLICPAGTCKNPQVVDAVVIE